MNLGWVSYNVNEIPLETIFDSDNKFCFLVGSGISLEKPSCLPTGYQFVKNLLSRTIPNEENETILSLTNPERKTSGEFLRFEELMELIEYLFDLKLILDVYANCKTPNLNHRILARFLINGHSIFTTNFDSLIEYALLEENVEKSKIIPAIWEKDWKDPTNEDQYFVYKLHGSLVDIVRDIDCYETLQTTLTQITQNDGALMELVGWKKQIFGNIIKKQDMIVLGYSGLDDFDVLPTLKKLDTSRNMIWISHKKLDLENAKIEKIEENSEYSNYGKSEIDRLGKELLSFCALDLNKKTQIIRIKVDTSKILIWLLNRYLKSLLPEVSKKQCTKFEFPLDIATQDFDKWFLAARIYHRRNFIEKSIHSYENALRLAERKRNMQMVAECYNNLALILKNQGKMQEALDYYKKSLVIVEAMDFGKAPVLNNIGSIFRAQGDFKEALKYFESALLILDEQGNMNEEASTLNNIGTIFLAQEKYDKALSLFNKSLKIARTQGNLYSISRTLDNIGALYLYQNQCDIALEYISEALEIADQLGCLKDKATRLNNKTSILVHQSKLDKSKLDKALEIYHDILKIDEQLSDVRGKATTLNNIASIHQRKGEQRRALKILFQVLKIDEKLGDLEGKTERLLNIAVIFSNTGNIKEAKTYFEEAKRIAKELNMPALVKRAREGLRRISRQDVHN